MTKLLCRWFGHNKSLPGPWRPSLYTVANWVRDYHCARCGERLGDEQVRSASKPLEVA